MLGLDETWVFHCTRTLTSPLTNTAVARGVDPLGGTVTSPPASAYVDVLGAGLQIDKLAPSAAFLGSTVAYEYMIYNSGKSDFALADLTIDDSGPGGCEPIRGPDTNGDNDDVLEPGERWNFTCSLELAEPMVEYVEELDDGEENVVGASAFVSNTFTVTGVDQYGTPVEPDPVTARVAISDPSISIVKTSDVPEDPGYVQPGDLVTYTYEVRNESPYKTSQNHLSNVTVTDDKCDEVTFVEDSDDGDGELGFIVDPDDPLKLISETWIFECTTPLEEPTTNIGTASGTAVVGDDSRVVTDEDDETVFVSLPSFTVEKTADRTTVFQAGQVIEYTI
ncbi:hypothetical protein, partial [Natronococcus sp.]|uniref:hypothetical protein n=1 Tax=Natronococcus sp. TaxID=35747 RepID=UPI003A4D404A